MIRDIDPQLERLLCFEVETRTRLEVNDDGSIRGDNSEVRCTARPVLADQHECQRVTIFVGAVDSPDDSAVCTIFGDAESGADAAARMVAMKDRRVIAVFHRYNYPRSRRHARG